jgi:integrase
VTWKEPRSTLNEYLDRWFETSVKPRVREKTYQDYEGMLRRYVRPQLGERVLAALRTLDLQTVYQQMTEHGLSARTVRYTHAILKSAIRRRCSGAYCCRGCRARLRVSNYRSNPGGKCRC